MANAIVMPYVLEFSRPECTGRLAELAEASGLKHEGDTDATLAQKFIDHIRSLNARFDIPEKLTALKAEDIPGIARAALREAHGTYAVPRYMDGPDCETFIGQIMA